MTNPEDPRFYALIPEPTRYKLGEKQRTAKPRNHLISPTDPPKVTQDDSITYAQGDPYYPSQEENSDEEKG